MDIGKLNNNTSFYDGYEDEPEVTLTIAESENHNIHIWDGFFYDIFGDPVMNGMGWKGFTRDYNQMERCFGDEDYVIKDIKEYLDDLMTYNDKEYDDIETSECYSLLCNFLKFAYENHYHIKVHRF